MLVHPRILLGKDWSSHNSFHLMECPETSCVLTSNRSLLANVTQYDAIGRIHFGIVEL
jgi:hypothetical protein